MKKKIASKLRKIADTLPPCTTTSRMEHIRVKGSEILSENPDAKVRSKFGNEMEPVEPNTTYVQRVPAQLNHYRELKRMYESHGEAGVTEYTNMVRRKAAQEEIQQIYEKISQEFPALSDVVKQENFSTTSPAYNKILEYGIYIVPFILQDMQKEIAPWFELLQKLAGENPVLPENEGNMAKMTNDWLLWGVVKKYFAMENVKFADENPAEVMQPVAKKRGRPKKSVEIVNDQQDEQI